MRLSLLAAACSLCFCSLFASAPLAAEEPPLVEKFLHSGRLLEGDQELEAHLRKTPDDDQARFGLGFLRAVRALERLSQTMYEYGLKSEVQTFMAIRLPVPQNPDPATINYFRFRRAMEDFRLDLERAESTLAKVQDDQVKLPLRIASVKLDLDGDGVASDQFLDLLKKLWRTEIPLLKDNPDFKICFDRGDVAWLRAYTHALMAVCELSLSLESEAWFENYAQSAFAKVQKRGAGDPSYQKVQFYEARRLGRFRLNVIAICELNRETWRYIRAETDNDYEWLPSSEQKSVLGLPIREEMVDSWLDAVTEVESLFKGEKIIPVDFLGKEGKGLNIAVFLDDPPYMVEGDIKSLPDKYWIKNPPCDIAKFIRVLSAFDNPLRMGYLFWMN